MYVLQNHFEELMGQGIQAARRVSQICTDIDSQVEGADSSDRKAAEFSKRQILNNLSAGIVQPSQDQGANSPYPDKSLDFVGQALEIILADEVDNNYIGINTPKIFHTRDITEASFDILEREPLEYGGEFVNKMSVDMIFDNASKVRILVDDKQVYDSTD
jgi:hypothetical protein